ncbi:hypothetical protein DAPPUDRAFT_113407 [Daphnia pulex]|uniref:Uncharacterized protein n=1 Tax=Daphnia pulex TaxID=6669 RepID=E9HEX8_DAPPU|nr:hypothetical protein DAPPUDRAFT_113407 [Daphnia pulex]|eukprot:EFX69708.1 hypothetical protein DAPPUDRAFT_113407 [Daphnia pulex]
METEGESSEDDVASEEESEDESNEDDDDEFVHHESNEKNDPITLDDSGAQGQLPPPVNGNASCVDSNGARQGPVLEGKLYTDAVLTQSPIAPHYEGHPDDHVIEESRTSSPRTHHLNHPFRATYNPHLLPLGHKDERRKG